jgi:hypothetical protein
MKSFDALASEAKRCLSELEQNHKLAVYSACFGDIDNVSHFVEENSVLCEFCDVILFTDADAATFFQTEIKIIHIKTSGKYPRLDAKFFKVLPHRFLSDYDVSIWIDSNMSATKASLLYMQKMENCNIATFEHNKRSYVYQEAFECVVRGKDSVFRIARLLHYISTSGFRSQSKLRQCRWLARRHMEQNVYELMEMWWFMILKFSIRDQLSLPFCIWKLKVDAHLLPYIESSDFFIVRPHLKGAVEGNGLLPYLISSAWSVIGSVRSRLQK